MRPTANLDASLLEKGTITGYLLRFVQHLDSNYGANEWETRKVALISAVLFLTIRLVMGRKYGVIWYPMIHGALSGYLSFVAVWISQFGAEPLTGLTEPLRSILCQGPLTSLHRIVPAITMGYGIFDIVDGAPHGIDFVRTTNWERTSNRSFFLPHATTILRLCSRTACLGFPS